MAKAANQLSISDHVFYVDIKGGVRFFNPKSIVLNTKEDTVTISDGFKDIVFRNGSSLKICFEIYKKDMDCHFFTDEKEAHKKLVELLKYEKEKVELSLKQMDDSILKHEFKITELDK